MSNSKHFKPKAHILRLLGNELIKSPIMAIYELVKNSYDADASYVNVNFSNITDTHLAKITVEDNGTGLTEEVIENVWLEPGTDHRKPIGDDGRRLIFKSPIYGRVPMGEKGVGRFAVHKLGESIKLISRPAIISLDKKECPQVKLLDYEIELIIDWNAFSQSKYLEDIPINWTIKEDVSEFHFKENSGTFIEVSNLKEPWTRGMARNLKRNAVSMLSPKNDESKFKINLDFENDWLADFPDAAQILDIAPYKYTALLDENYNLTVDYEFSMAINEDMGPRKITNRSDNIKGALIPGLRSRLESENLTDDEIITQIKKLEKQVNPFGSILLEIYSYDLDSVSLKGYTGDARTVKIILNQHSGIKVFKDDMRVFNYGEPGNDWLELDIKRVQNKSWFSNNQNIGFVYLDSESSTDLIEKTSREGFIENLTYQMFYQSVEAILNDFKIERLKDRNKWLALTKKASPDSSGDGAVSHLKDTIDSLDCADDKTKSGLKKDVDSIKKDFDEKKDTLLIPAGVGMTASVALHEIEKVVPRLKETLNSKPFKLNLANEYVDELDDYLGGILSVLRKGGNKPVLVHDSIDRAVGNYKLKLLKRNVLVQKDYDDSLESIKCDQRYFVTMIMNIVDNSIYWLETINKDNKGIYIKTWVEGGVPSILIVDNGPGFKDDVTDVVMPYFTRKEDGIGIGLYLVDTLMMKYGKVELLDSNELNELNVPTKYRGAAVRLTFSKNQ